MFVNTSDDVHKRTHTISDYVHFCVENNIQSKEVNVFPSNKPGVTKSVKVIINKKKQLFIERDTKALRQLQMQLKKLFLREICIPRSDRRIIHTQRYE